MNGIQTLRECSEKTDKKYIVYKIKNLQYNDIPPAASKQFEIFGLTAGNHANSHLIE
jgi:hypothetical protein